MSGSNQGIFNQLTKLPSATADGDAQVGLGIPSSRLQRLPTGRHLPSPPYPATSYTRVVVCKLQTMRPYRYLLLLTILISACERKSSDQEADKVDSLKETFWTKDFEFFEYKVEIANNGYGKKLFIDSLNYKIFRGYFPGDSTKLIHEHQEDLLNDTAVYNEYYLNGMLKESSRMTYRNRIPIKKHRFYDKKGRLIKEINYERNMSVNFDKAVKIAENEGMKKPFEIGVSADSLFWEMLVWKTIEFDSLTNRGIDKGLGLSIDRTNGQARQIERERRFVY